MEKLVPDPSLKLELSISLDQSYEANSKNKKWSGTSFPASFSA